TVPFVRSGTSPAATIAAPVSSGHTGIQLRSATGGEEVLEDRRTGAALDADADRELVVEPGVLTQVVEAAERSGIHALGSDHHPADACGPQRPRAHRARLECDDHQTVGESPSTQLRARVTEGEDLGVGGSVVAELPLVVASGEHPGCGTLGELHDDRSDGNVAVEGCGTGLVESDRHPPGVLRIGFQHRRGWGSVGHQRRRYRRWRSPPTAQPADRSARRTCSPRTPTATTTYNNAGRRRTCSPRATRATEGYKFGESRCSQLKWHSVSNSTEAQMKPGSAGQGTTDGDDTERPGLRERKKERVREQIRQAALDLFDQRDLDSVTVDEIAERAEVSKSTLFRYFETKEDLVFANSRAYGDTLLAAFAERPSDESVLRS